ncbi:hypothetical protein PO909_005840 [Leuciscus waleckii]
MDLMDAHTQCPTCLGIDHLREALVDPCPECGLMSLEMRRHRLAELDPEFRDSAPSVGAASHVSSKRVASQRVASGTGRPSKKMQTSSESSTLTQQVAELANAVQGIKALLSVPPTRQNMSEGNMGVLAPPLPRCELASSFSRRESDTLSIAASDSLDREEQDYYMPMQETIPSHSQFQRSHSDDGSSVQDAPSSVVFSLQDTLKMALAKRNLDPPLPGPVKPLASLSFPARGFPNAELS